MSNNREVTPAAGLAESAPEEDGRIAVSYRYSQSLPEILQHLQASIILTTYQAGKVMLIGLDQGQVRVSYVDLEQPMGLAIGHDQIAIGGGASVHFYHANHRAAGSVAADCAFDGCFVPNHSRHTGRILSHDVAWGHEGLWVVNTLFSCLCTLDSNHSFVPRWKPGFVTALADEDRCHLNGLAMESEVPRYVTALAATDTPNGWREHKASGGCLIDVHSGMALVEGLSMPHSPRLRDGELFVLNSGHGELARVDRNRGTLETIERVPGFTRGLAFQGQFAFVGLSRIRESNVFGGLPIADQPESLCCGVAIIDLVSGKNVASFRFLSGVEEIFAVELIPGHLNVLLGGGHYDHRRQEVWVVPPSAAEIPSRLEPIR